MYIQNVLNSFVGLLHLYNIICNWICNQSSRYEGGGRGVGVWVCGWVCVCVGGGG